MTIKEHAGAGIGRDKSRPYKYIGAPLPKVDVYAKVTGRALYADDIMLPRMLYGRLLRSPHPHARIISIDIRRAIELPGVLAIITGEDLPQRFGILPSSQDEYALANDKVRYVGDPVAAVASLDPDILDEAMKLIEVEYEVLPALMSIDEALEHPEVKINDEARTGIIHKAVSYEFGDMEAGFASADYTREEVFLIHRGRHPVKMWIKTGVKQDGTLTAMHFRSFLDGGAYGSYGVAT